MTNRRAFLKLLTTGALSSTATGSLLISQGCSHKKLLNPDEDILLSGGYYEENNQRQNALVLIKPVQREKKLILTKFLPHGIFTDPNNKHRVICFEKNGTQACDIDILSQNINQIFTIEKGHQFSGHGAFSFDGKYLYTVETDIHNQQGSIAIRHAKTFDFIKRLPTLGLNPHDCQLLKDDVLVISNTGQDKTKFHQPSLVYLNLKTEKLIQRKKLDDDTLNCGHFEIGKENNLVVASAPADTNTINGGISMESPRKDFGENSGEKFEQPIQTMKEPVEVIQRMTGEALSISINESKQIAAVTHPQANLLTFWSLRDKKIIKAIGIEKPQGIEQTVDEKSFIVSYGKHPAMAGIDIETLSPQADSIVQPTNTSGEHILNWSRNLRTIMPTRVYG